MTQTREGGAPERVSAEGTWPAHCEQRAFVEGAAWWEFRTAGATMWNDDRRCAEDEAVRRYGEPGAPELGKVGALVAHLRKAADGAAVRRSPALMHQAADALCALRREVKEARRLVDHWATAAAAANSRAVAEKRHLRDEIEDLRQQARLAARTPEAP